MRRIILCIKILFVSGVLVNVMAQDYLTVPKEYLRPKAYEDEASRYNFENDRFKPDRRNKENWYIITVNPDSYFYTCLLYTSPSPRDATLSRMPSSA